MRTQPFKLWKKQGTYKLQREQRHRLRYIVFILSLIAVTWLLVGCAKLMPDLIECHDGYRYAMNGFNKKQIMTAPDGEFLTCDRKLADYRLELRPDLKEG